MARNIQVPAVKVNQDAGSKKAIFITSLKVRDLIEKSQFDIDYWDPKRKGTTDQGYQRHPSNAHLRKIASYITNFDNALFPSAILVNCRKPVEFIPGKGGIGLLTMIHPPFYIVDGQHRIEGLRHAIQEVKDERWLDRELPAVIMSGFDRIEEVQQFQILNTTQKRVATDLAQRLLGDRVMANPELRKTLVGESSEWIIRALKVIDLLNEKPDSPWYKMIRLPNTERIASHVINQNSFVVSLRPLFKDGYFSSRKDADHSYQVLKDYWLALKKIFPAAFLESKDYVIQKTPGIFSLHGLAHKIMLRGLPEYNEKVFTKVLKAVFSGAEYDDHYWQSDNRDGASQFGSMKGFKILEDEFIQNLPEEL